MPAPTEPGYYWRRDSPDSPWRVVEHCRNGCIMAHSRPIVGPCPICESDGVEWGPRIPGPDQIEAMRQVCQAHPFRRVQRDANHAIYQCRHCHAQQSTERGDAGESFPHAPDCPYPRAQEKPR